LINLHNEGYGHRNIRLDTIYLDEDFNAKITYFDNTSTNDDRIIVCGNMTYWSPGLKHGQENDYMKDDVYALGISLFQMVTKCYPFGRGNANKK